MLQKKKEIVSKGELYIEYQRLPQKVKVQCINRIICKVRKVSLAIARNVKTLRPKEVRLFKEEFDEDYF